MKPSEEKIEKMIKFMDKELNPKGNLFNADRDNNGKGIPIDEMIDMLQIPKTKL